MATARDGKVDQVDAAAAPPPSQDPDADESSANADDSKKAARAWTALGSLGLIVFAPRSPGMRTAPTRSVITDGIRPGVPSEACE
jgi:hypothetical protein